MMTVREYANRLGVDFRIVQGWINSGELIAIDVRGSGARRKQLRISEDAAAAFEASRKLGATTPRRRRRRSRVDAAIEEFNELTGKTK